MAKLRVLVLGAGFGGLELSAMLSEAIPDRLDLTLIDRNDSFVFGYSKLDVVFGRKNVSDVRIPYAAIAKPGVRFIQDAVMSIDPVSRRVRTVNGSYEGDVLVVALGADYDIQATPGLEEAGNEFYSVDGADRLHRALPAFVEGNAIIGVASAPFKCPPAPSEAALLLHDHLMHRHVRRACTISLIMPFAVPVPPSPPASQSLLTAFAKRGITFVPNRSILALDPAKRVAILDDQSELPFDLFLGIPRHRVPAVVEQSGLPENGWVPVDPKNLKTRFPGVYALGDIANQGTPKAGVFAEGAARAVAGSIAAEQAGKPGPGSYDGRGSCYVEFGANLVGRVDVDFLSGPKPTGTFLEPSAALVREKEQFGSARRARWFGGA